MEKFKKEEFKHLVINLTEQDWKDLSVVYTKAMLRIMTSQNGGKVDQDGKEIL